MRHLAVILATLFLAACGTGPVTRNESPAASPTQAPAPEPQKASTDQVEQFLVTSAATDFHTHGPSGPLRFHNVRIGHLKASDGKEQYMLCGEFHPAGKAEWTPFVTIKTSGYEQWMGAQATGFCQRPSVSWDKGDLSSSLQSKLDSLR